MTSNAAFKKRVRELSAQQDIPYAEARSRLLSAKTSTSDAARTHGKNRAADAAMTMYAQLIGTALIGRAREMQRADDALERAERAWVETQERKGLRVVSGGQTGTYDEDGKAPWTVRDWRTHETLATGVSSYDDVTWADNWIDISAADVALNGVDLDPATKVVDELPADTPPQVRSFIGGLVAAMEYEDWSLEFAEWVGENRG
ncbi:hypothetical protein [Cryobacterium arcticum]|nr:hypothetical protein [Cryobacterium arcticum]